MGFMVEGSTGARAVAMLKALPTGTIIETPEFALALGVKAGALHQLLANAVKLRLIRKRRERGCPCIGWQLGPGNVGTTIEPRRNPPSPEEMDRRRAAAARRARRAAITPAEPVFRRDSNWPPGFVSTFTSPELKYQPPSEKLVDDGAALDMVRALPSWLRGLMPGAPPAPEPMHAPLPPPRPVQLPLFDVSEIGEPGRARWRRHDLAPTAPPLDAPTTLWRQASILEV